MAVRLGNRAGVGGLVTASAWASNFWGQSQVLDPNEALAMSEMVSVEVQKRGEKFFQPMVRVSGMATRFFSPWIPGKTSPSFGTSAGLRPIR